MANTVDKNFLLAMGFKKRSESSHDYAYMLLIPSERDSEEDYEPDEEGTFLEVSLGSGKPLVGIACMSGEYDEYTYTSLRYCEDTQAIKYLMLGLGIPVPAEASSV